MSELDDGGNRIGTASGEVLSTLSRISIGASSESESESKRKPESDMMSERVWVGCNIYELCTKALRIPYVMLPVYDQDPESVRFRRGRGVLR